MPRASIFPSVASYVNFMKRSRTGSGSDPGKESRNHEPSLLHHLTNFPSWWG